MANTLGSNEGALVARKALDTLLESYPFFGQITTDFSDEGALFNQAITVKLPSAIATSAYSTTNGYVAANVTQVDKTVTIDTHEHVTYAFHDQELTATNQNLVERFGRNAGHAIGKSIMADLDGLVLATNYTAETAAIADGALDAAALATLQTDLDTLNLPNVGRFAVVTRLNYGNLLGETTIISNAGAPRDTVKSGMIGDVYGFTVYSHAVPNNSEALAGYVGTGDALLLAARVPKIPESTERNCSIHNVSEPNTGLTIQVREWYEPKEGKLYCTFTLMWGVGVGNPAALKRIVTA